MENDGAVLIVQDVTERRNAQAAIERLAKFDTITGLPNRVQLEQRLNEIAAASSDTAARAAVLFIDLDDFKQVNDTLGHARGDGLLRVVADRLRTFEPAVDMVTRWGGDEFALLFSNINSEAEVCATANKIIEKYRNPA